MEGLSQPIAETKTPFQLDREQYEVGDVRYRAEISDIPVSLPNGEPHGMHVEVWQETANEFKGWSVIGRTIKASELYKLLEKRDDAKKLAHVSISESSLKEITWGVICGKNLDGSPLWLLQGKWPNGGHCAFIPVIPELVDEVRQDPENDEPLPEIEGAKRYLPPKEADWLKWHRQHDRVTVHPPDDPASIWANQAGGSPRWTIWSWCGGSGGVTAWCDSEGAARLLAGSLEELINSKSEESN